MFMGQFQHSLDHKGRLIVPAKFREILGPVFVLTKGLDSCLFAYSYDEWALLEQKLKSLSFTHKDSRAFIRMFFSGAVEAELDRQGRILIPAHLREHAHIDKDVMVLGVSNRVEIWGLEQWDSYSKEAAQSYEEIAEKLDLDI